MQIAIRAYRSAKGGSVPDDTTRAIDRFFDVIDNGVDVAHRVLHRGAQTEEKLQKSKRSREVIDATSADKPKAKSPSPSTAVTKKPHFYIKESIDPKTGDTLFVVTDGGNARAECTTRELAAQILRALEKRA